MNPYIPERITNEKFLDIMRSIELFVALVVGISVVGFVCLAAL